MSVKRKAAHRLIDKGLHILFCKPNSKEPATRHGLKDATRNHAEVDRMFDRDDFNIGIHTGRSGVVVIDVDRKHGVDGWEAVDATMMELGELPGCKMVSTPGGGAHLYFRDPTGGALKPNAGKLGAGIDVRCGESYVVAPPSSIDGKAYRWDIFNTPTPELPATWVEALRPAPVPETPCEAPRHPERYLQAALDAEVETLLGAIEGERNHALARFGFVLATLDGITDDQIRDAGRWCIARWQWTHGQPNHRKDRDTLERAMAEGRRRPREQQG